MMCACLGPQNGQPLCPCKMRARDYLFGHTWTIPEHLQSQSGPACWNELACGLHKCRELGCAVMRERPAPQEGITK